MVIMNKEKVKKIQFILNVVFILTIISVWLGIKTMIIFLDIKNIPSPLFFEYSWLMLFWIPVPILSITLGIIYNKQVNSYIKNIVAGILSSLLLILFGSFSVIFNFDIDYNNIYSYQNILGVSIPTEGQFYRINMVSDSLEETANYIRFTNSNEAEIFYIELQDNEKWILGNDINEDLNTLIPSATLCEAKDGRCYYLIYINESNSYNKMPQDYGMYHVNVFMYDYSKYTLTINEYIYNYKN